MPKKHLKQMNNRLLKNSSKSFNKVLTPHDVDYILSKLDELDLKILDLVGQGNIPSHISRILSHKYHTILYRIRKLIKLGLIVRRKWYQGYIYYLTLMGEMVVKKFKRGGSGLSFGFENVGVYFVVDSAISESVLGLLGFKTFGHRRDKRVLGWSGRVEGCSVIVYPGRRKFIVYAPPLKSSDVTKGFAEAVITCYRVGEYFARLLRVGVEEYGLVGKPQFVTEDPVAESFYRLYGSYRSENVDINNSHDTVPTLELKDLPAAQAYSMIPIYLAKIFEKLDKLEENQVQIVKALDRLTTVFERLLGGLEGSKEDKSFDVKRSKGPEGWYL